MKHQIIMSSKNSSWETPKSLFDRLDKIFKFSLDAAANASNRLCPLFLTEEENALSTDWQAYMQYFQAPTDTVFLNPPYGHGVLPWMRKVKQEYEKGLTVVVLVAARTDTKFHQIGWTYARHFIFLYGRLHFTIDGIDQGPATFPSVLMVFSPRPWNLWPLMDLGKVITQNVITQQELRAV